MGLIWSTEHVQLWVCFTVLQPHSTVVMIWVTPRVRNAKKITLSEIKPSFWYENIYKYPLVVNTCTDLDLVEEVLQGVVVGGPDGGVEDVVHVVQPDTQVLQLLRELRRLHVLLLQPARGEGRHESHDKMLSYSAHRKQGHIVLHTGKSQQTLPNEKK